MSVIDVSGLTFAYEGSPELIFDHVSFQFDTGHHHRLRGV